MESGCQSERPAPKIVPNDLGLICTKDFMASFFPHILLTEVMDWRDILRLLQKATVTRPFLKRITITVRAKSIGWKLIKPLCDNKKQLTQI